MYLEFLEVLTQFYKVLFKVLSSLRNRMLALSGPAYIVCPLEIAVKDMPVYNLKHGVLYKGHRAFRTVLEPYYKLFTSSTEIGQWSLPYTFGYICAFFMIGFKSFDTMM